MYEHRYKRISTEELRQRLGLLEKENPSLSVLLSQRDFDRGDFVRVGTNSVTNQPVYACRKGE
ncbi:hypothetical protein KY316_01165 [Candidatus Woesearchaeota archaeon]|nr:hypothetical protein [Candidatus Woesearchaeota archaeon]